MNTRMEASPRSGWLGSAEQVLSETEVESIPDSLHGVEESYPMIAVTVVSPDLRAEIEPRFGRAPYVLLVNPETLEWTSLENPGRQARGGAGIRLVQLLNDQGVDGVISGRLGPKATDALAKAGITMHPCDAPCTAEEAVLLLRDGKLGAQEALPFPKHPHHHR